MQKIKTWENQVLYTPAACDNSHVPDPTSVATETAWMEYLLAAPGEYFRNGAFPMVAP